MTTTKSSTETRIKRCAVCRIDLKGRFVYADERAQTLLGLPLEKLFARPITDYLEESDHDVITHLLTQPNRYESFFKTARVTVIDEQKQVIPSWIVASLSFAAGNPVNFLILINPEETEETVAVAQAIETPPVANTDFLDLLSAPGEISDLNELVGTMREFIGEAHILAYEADESGLALLTRTDSGAEIVGEPTSLHQRVLETGQEYSFTDQDSVQAAVEANGEAPNEYLFRLDRPEETALLVRVCFYEAPDSAETSAALQRAKSASQLLQKMVLTNGVESGPEVPAPVSQPGLAPQTPGSIESPIVDALVLEVGAAVKAATELSSKLGHENYNKLDSQSNFHLLCLKDNLDRTAGMVTAFTKFLDLAGRKPKPETTDLNLVFNEVRQRIAAAYPQVKLNLEYRRDLPKIETDSAAITHVVHSLLVDLIPFASGQIVNVSVEAGSESGKCQIKIDCDTAITREYLSELKDFFARPAIDYNMHLPSTYGGLFAARYLLRKLGGTAILESARKGLHIQLTLDDGSKVVDSPGTSQ